MNRRATANWKGDGATGQGTLNSSNKFFNNTPYSTKSRFQNEDGMLGTNPEELIAAAHAGCFNMALSFALGGNSFPPTELNTEATVTIEQTGVDFKITAIKLELSGKVENITKEKFLEIAEGAKKTCPVSQALSSVPITLEIKEFSN